MEVPNFRASTDKGVDIGVESHSGPGELGRSVLDMIRDAEGQLDVTTDLLRGAAEAWPTDERMASYLETTAAFVAGQRSILEKLMQTIVEVGVAPPPKNLQTPGQTAV